MKLPEDKKERVQIMVLGAILLAGVLYAAIFFGVRPMIKAKKERAARMAELATKIKEAKEYLDLTEDNGAKNYEFLSKIKEFSDQHFLKPRLGDNYALGVGEMVEAWGVATGMKLAPPTELGRIDVPHSEAARAPVRAYTFTADPKGGARLRDLIRLLQHIEKQNPAMSVIRLSIVANPGDPLKHTINLAIQTPIWGNHDEMTAKLAADLDAAAKSRKARPHEGRK